MNRTTTNKERAMNRTTKRTCDESHYYQQERAMNRTTTNKECAMNRTTTNQSVRSRETIHCPSAHPPVGAV